MCSSSKATVDGSEVTVGSRVKVAGAIAFYDAKQQKGQTVRQKGMCT